MRRRYNPKWRGFAEMVESINEKKHRKKFLIQALQRSRKFPYYLPPYQNAFEEAIKWLKASAEKFTNENFKVSVYRPAKQQYELEKDYFAEVNQYKLDHKYNWALEELEEFNKILEEEGHPPIFEKKHMFKATLNHDYDMDFYSNVLKNLREGKSRIADIDLSGPHRFCEMASLFYSIDIDGYNMTWKGIQTYNLITREFRKKQKYGEMCPDCDVEVSQVTEYCYGRRAYPPTKLIRPDDRSCPWDFCLEQCDIYTLYWFWRNNDHESKSKLMMPAKLKKWIEWVEWNCVDFRGYIKEYGLSDDTDFCKIALDIMHEEPSYSYHEGCGLKYAFTRAYRDYFSIWGHKDELTQLSNWNQYADIISRVPCFDCTMEEIQAVNQSSKRLNRDAWEIIFDYLLEMHLQ